MNLETFGSKGSFSKNSIVISSTIGVGRGVIIFSAHCSQTDHNLATPLILMFPVFCIYQKYIA